MLLLPTPPFASTIKVALTSEKMESSLCAMTEISPFSFSLLRREKSEQCSTPRWPSLTSSVRFGSQ